MIQVYPLGTSSAIPSHGRNLPSLLLNFQDHLFMLDCGDGTQLHLRNSPYKMSKLQTIIISHLHGDHIYGLPGLISSLFFQNPRQKLTLFAPPPLEEFLNQAASLEQANHPFTFFPLEDGSSFDYGDFILESRLLDHRVPCFGVSITEKDKSGKLKVQKLIEDEIEPGPIYGKIKEKQDVILDNGKTINWQDYLEPDIKGQKVVYCTDTKVTPNFSKLAQNADLLISESTYAPDLAELANNYHHLTAAEAIEMASASQVKNLVLTHYSSRYRDPEYILKGCEIPAELIVKISKEYEMMEF